MDVGDARLARRVLGRERGDLPRDAQRPGPCGVVRGGLRFERGPDPPVAAQDRRCHGLHVDDPPVAGRYDVDGVLLGDLERRGDGRHLERRQRRCDRGVQLVGVDGQRERASGDARPHRGRELRGCDPDLRLSGQERDIVAQQRAGSGGRRRHSCGIDLRVERADRQGDHVAVGARQHVHERRARLFPQDPGAGARLDRDDTRTVEPQAALDCGVAGLRRPAVEHALEPLVVVDHSERDVLGAHEPPGGAGELREEVAAPAGVHGRAGGGPGVDREVEERGVGRRLVAVDPHADGRA